LKVLREQIHENLEFLLWIGGSTEALAESLSRS
jgi:hypothetical protein